MTPERWQRIGALFEAALERPLAERATFLDDACAGDQALRREVEALLWAADGADNYFASLAGRAGVPPFAGTLPGEQPPEDQQVGPYRLLREIGRGGMGTVYLAERADGQFHQQVALKLVRQGSDSNQVLQRFLRERQILARLRHPHIARLYDGGLSEDGRPYFAMEYVEGVPLTDYCDAHCLSIDARLRLFTAVGEAVQYAHRNLVVHRDLKPSNILVTPSAPGTDSVGEIKLLDFGIAKLLGGDTTDESWATLTQTGVRVMTPAYAAPEQVQGAPITTATDVYTLGVILYELLTGHRPHQAERPTPEALAAAVLEHEPERPSTVVSRAREIARDDGTTETITPATISQARSTQAERLRRRLSGDLDTICLMALRKEPERRYASAEAFVEDVRRHLAGLPVHARPDTAGYRMRKFIRRHRVGAAAVVLVVTALAAGLAVALWQAGVARHETAKAEAVRSFLEELFEASDPNNARGDTLTARTLLDRGAERVEALAGQPAIQGEMLMVLGGLYQKLALHEEARRLMEQALTIRRNVYGSNHPEVAESLNELGATFHYLGDYDEAERLYREALAMRRALFGEHHIDVAETQSHLASLRHTRGDYDEAERLYRAALATRRNLLGNEHTDVAQSLSYLARLRHTRGDYDEAERLYREALATRRNLLGNEHTDVAQSLSYLASVLEDKGDYAQAEQIQRDVLAMKRTLLGNDHPDVAVTLSNLATVLRSQGHYSKAEQLYREALAIQRKRLGDGHPRVSTSLNNLAAALYDQGRYEEAERLYREVLDRDRQVLGDDHPHVATTLNNLAAVLRVEGDYEEAERLHYEVLAIKRKQFGDDHPSVATSLYNLARVLHDKGTYEEAERLYREVLDRDRQVLGDDHPDLAPTLNNLARLLRDTGRPDAAEPLQREALALLLKHYGDADGRTAEAKSTLGVCLTALGRYTEAEPLLLASHAVLQDEYGDAHKLTQQARQALAELYTAWGKPAQAAPYAASPTR